MKSLLIFVISFWSALAIAQAPEIEGDTMLCPGGEGTAYIVTDMAYDSYQWQVKAYGETAFEDIEGATAATFTYDQYTYSVTQIRVQVTLGGNTYNSNSLSIDGMAFLPIFYWTETNELAEQNADTWLICEGGTVTNTVGMPYTIVQWYKDDVAIPGATSTSYVITEPGIYYAKAYPPGCPDSEQTTLSCVVNANPDCDPPSSNPVIDGDTMLCQNGDGTSEVTNDIEYDSYQWQVKFYGETEFVDVDGETEATFTYDAYTYSLAQIRVEVTLDGETYVSNVLAIDGYAFLPISYMTETDGDVTFVPEQGYFLCPGGTITNTVGNPYNNVQWYKDEVAIEGATSQTYVVTEPGEYYAVAYPSGCPNNSQTTLVQVVLAHADCSGSGGVPPIIDGDVMLCPDTDGTAEVTNDVGYDSYQWYVKFDGDEEFSEVEGETEPTFTYDAYNYIMAEIKVVVTLGDDTYESNIITIDGYAWGDIYIISDTSGDNVEIQGDGSMLLCEGTGFSNEIAMPYEANIQWYKNNEPIEGATETTYTITMEGSYHVEGAPAYCPNAMNSTAGTPIVVAMQDCTAGIGDNEAGSFSLYPNPASTLLNITFGQNTSVDSYTIYDVAGKAITSGNITAAGSTINIAALAQGTYVIRMTGENTNTSKLFIKQ